jgi:hypothetical protein
MEAQPGNSDWVATQCNEVNASLGPRFGAVKGVVINFADLRGQGEARGSVSVFPSVLHHRDEGGTIA